MFPELHCSGSPWVGNGGGLSDCREPQAWSGAARNAIEERLSREFLVDRDLNSDIAHECQGTTEQLPPFLKDSQVKARAGRYFATVLEALQRAGQLPPIAGIALVRARTTAASSDTSGTKTVDQVR